MKEKIIATHFGITTERSIELVAEFIYYAHKHCLCANNCYCFHAEKGTRMLFNWPGSLLTPQERSYLFFMMGVHYEQIHMYRKAVLKAGADTANGEDYNIARLRDLVRLAYVEVLQSSEPQNN